MNYRDLKELLKPMYGQGEAQALARMVMEELYGLSLADLLLGKDSALSAKENEELEKIASLLAAGHPVQYVLGYAHFCGHRFHVTSDVLIPRPETEELVRWALERPARNYLDLGTGSGCIAVSLALAQPEARVTALELSNAALNVARENAQQLGADVSFVSADMLSLVVDPSPLTAFAPFDCMVSNPPYVCDSEVADMERTVVENEPHMALFVPDDDPLIYYRAIVAIGQRILVPGGRLLVEANTALTQATADLFREAGYVDVEVRNDQFGRPRMVGGLILRH